MSCWRRRAMAISEWVPTQVMDRLRRAAVITNLVGNALVHGLAGTVAVKIDGSGRDVVLICRNAGASAPQELPHLFTPFRGGHPHGNRTSGLGLGPYISASIVEQHG